MADIFNGGTVKLFYNLDAANQNVISSGNIEIENVATFPTFSISDSVNKIETYDSEYTRAVVGDKSIGDLEIVVNYRPDSETHHFLDSAYDSKTEFQLILNYIEDDDAGKVEAVIVSGNINSRIISGDKDEVVRMTYTYSPRTVLSMGTRVIPPVLRRGDYGVGSDGTPDYPQYSPQEAEGNAFVMIPAADTDNPAGTDLYGIELVSQPTGQTNTNLMLTNSGDLRIYARNNSTPWSRVYTSGESDTLYLSKSNNLSDLDSIITARSNLGILSTLENDARYMIGSHNLSELTDVTVARTKLSVLSIAQNDAKYLQAVNNLNDIDDTSIARTNLDVQSTSESDSKYVPKTTTINNHELTGNITISSADTGSLAIINNLSDVPDPVIARTNLGVQSTSESDSKYLIKSNNLSDISDIADARSNLDVQSTSESDSKYLIKSNNLSDISDIAIARTSLNVNRILQDTSYTSMFSSDMKGQLTVRDDGEWGMYYSDPEPSESGWRALGIQQGGTGANDDATARINLKVDSLLQQPTETQLCTPDRTKYMFIQNAGGWGAYDTTSGQRQPLPLASGGTGALDAAGALTNLGIAWENEVRFKRVTINGTPGNNSSGFLCNVPSGGGDSWRDRGTGLAIQGSNVRGGAVSIIKVSIPGQGYIGALEGFLYSNGATELRVSVEGGSIFQFSSDGAGRANNWISLSDQRLKTDILPISNALDKLDKINGYTYRKFINMEAAKNNDVTNISHEAGVLAQEIKEALPEAVSAYGEDSVLGIKAGAIDALLINAVKELNTQVKEQHEQITQLMVMVNAQNITITKLKNK
ncbi:tail fiber domain-containing protein [Citrobacter youngae]|uniref:tail fiber domain-containing protein n=1 Tax=Citrobacter youngae TaxID=133448 RepID=UPI00397ADA57